MIVYCAAQRLFIACTKSKSILICVVGLAYGVNEERKNEFL